MPQKTNAQAISELLELIAGVEKTFGELQPETEGLLYRQCRHLRNQYVRQLKELFEHYLPSLRIEEAA